MKLLTMIDSEHPVIAPPGVTVTAFYLDSPNAGRAWPAAEVAAIKTRYRLPIWVAPTGGLTADQGQADAVAAARQVAAHGIAGHKIPRRRRAVALDLETQVSSAYVVTFAAQLAARGYATLVYGSLSTVTGNPPCRGYWAGQWDDIRHQAKGAHIVATQYTNNVPGGWDLSVISSGVCLADYGPAWIRRVLAQLAALRRQVIRHGHVAH